MTFRMSPAVLLCAALIGCSPVYKTTETLAPPANSAGLRCVAQCQEIKSTCNRSGHDRHKSCMAEQRISAEKSFYEYRALKMMAIQEVDKTVDDYINPNHCSADASYRRICNGGFKNCFTMCGGSVTTQKVCVRNCD